MKEPIGILVAGSANPHIPGYCRGFANDPEYPWKIIAVADHDPARMANIREILKNKKVEYYSDWRKMLDAHPEADAVQIGSDNKDHFEMFREAMDRGYHIYSTKVPTMDPEEGAQLLKWSRNYSKVIQVELELHFNPQFRYARELVRSGRLGRIRSVYLTNISQSPCNYFPNWGDPELSYGKVVPIRPGADYFRGGALTDGTYTSVQQGYLGDVTVTVTVSGGTVSAVEVDAGNETPALGGVAAEQLAAELAETGSTAGVDVVAGSTYTSQAVLDGMDDCLAQASAG